MPQGLSPNLKTADCQRLGFKAAIYPCTGFIPAMLAMRQSYTALKNEGTDLQHCEGNTIKDFFAQLGLVRAWEFDNQVEDWARNEMTRISGGKES